MLRKAILIWCVLQLLNAEDEYQPGSDTPSSGQSQPASSVESDQWSPNRGKVTRSCLTGYMTDMQAWVDEIGNLRPELDTNYLVDVSSRLDPVVRLRQQLQGNITKTSPVTVEYLSLSKCSLKEVPSVFHFKDRRGRALYSMVKYLTLYGNYFTAVSPVGYAFDEAMNATHAMQFNDVAIRWHGSTSWAAGFNHVKFQKLQELDLRNCNIQHLNDYFFRNMPELQALYLSENCITFISVRAFSGLYSLIHLDLSRNFDGSEPKGIVFEHFTVSKGLGNLRSLDLSMSPLGSQRDVAVISGLHKLTRLSVCYSGLTMFPKGILERTSLKFLDVSGNNGILYGQQPLYGLSDKLKVLYAKEVGLRSFDIFQNFSKLEVLDIGSNEVNVVSKSITQTLESLQILNLNNNRITSWFGMHFSYMKQLKLLFLRNNNINIVTKAMIRDMQNISYIGLSENFIVCNCQVRELFEIAYRNERKWQSKPILPKAKVKLPFSYHTGFEDFNNIIDARSHLVRTCDKEQPCRDDDEIDSEGNFVLVNCEENLYHCMTVPATETIPFSQVQTCPQIEREADYIEVITESRRKLLALLVIPIFVFPILIFCYVFRRNLKYFWITLRNSATLSMINNSEVIDDGTIFNYDVFVSYCNDDRDWVLDELLPHVEKGCNISICLHERDFQVGLSILENIVSCMDRSRSIMLIISKQFLMSQWCQFEMHLAQHRLLETRREDLILVLVEDIPRRLRPTTLHYLMLTKTYIVWPKKEGERPVFWKRLSKSILSRRQVTQDNISLA